MDLKIRNFESKDRDGINRIRAAIEHESGRGDLKNIEEAYFVAEREGEVVGYILSYILTGSFGVGKSAWIATIGIDPRFMGQGIGKQLADQTLRHFQKQGIQTVYASIRWDATDILSFFKALGFDRSAFINLKKDTSDHAGG